MFKSHRKHSKQTKNKYVLHIIKEQHLARVFVPPFSTLFFSKNKYDHHSHAVTVCIRIYLNSLSVEARCHEKS